MINSADLSGKVAFDANGLNNLKQAAKENSPEAIKGVAKQFEAIFMNMMLKSMREASPQDSPFDNEQSRTFTAMLDQQLSSNLASKGLGLADVLARQLSKGGDIANNTMEQAVTDVPPNLGNSSSFNNPIISNPLSPSQARLTESKIEQKTVPTYAFPTAANSLISNPSNSSTEFKNRMAHHAAEASRATGVPAHLMLGQAALESGWGKRELKGTDGSPSNNLFGIKATGNWDGKIVEATTTEYINGVKQKRIEKFRAYDSYADSFKDFANMMSKNPRYEKVMANLDDVNGYAQAMQKAGYATDPNYATKLASVIQKVSP
ncbi:flagellar assembly peptidoglycan hydrolase FlgJ [Hydrogenophaga sp.]|uniref:flagellar assembly peptidoglycan hydrolase FlgJ n=1 Tax=Hydrogenophaga sp. TaxID=1904254 RepID=UPI002735B86E|nr:flagellar assembly peptidoglycan hydrolase FlgJ [Hydrogenophaga sp.]MDP3886666.1 flagellar assembly peptidoglycan hydrolase FlgJ [Hydrogenophaga sp.]